MNMNEKIEARLLENKTSVKTYATYSNAVSAANDIVDMAKREYEVTNELRYIIAYVESTQRFTPVFMLTEFMNTANIGGYIGWVAARGYFSI